MVGNSSCNYFILFIDIDAQSKIQAKECGMNLILPKPLTKESIKEIYRYYK